MHMGTTWLKWDGLPECVCWFCDISEQIFPTQVSELSTELDIYTRDESPRFKDAEPLLKL